MNIKKFLTITILSFVLSLGFIPSSFSQLNVATLKQLTITFRQADFNKFSVSDLQLQVQNLNFNTGYIAHLTARCINLTDNNFYLDDLALTLKNIYFDTDALLKGQEVILKRPVNSEIAILVSEQGLNKFLNSKKVLKKLANAGKVNFNKLGLRFNGNFISFHDPKVNILDNNTLKISMNADIPNQVNIPITLYTKPVASNGKIQLTSSRIVSSGASLPKEVSGILTSVLNTIIDLDKIFKDEATVRINTLQFKSDKSIYLKGKALIKKLKLTKHKK